MTLWLIFLIAVKIVLNKTRCQMKKVTFLVFLFLQFPFVCKAEDKCTTGRGVVEGLLETTDIKPFSTKGVYQSVYNIIRFLGIYQDALSFHMDPIKTLPDNAVVIEAGGGTGLMNARARKLRPDLKLYLMDINPAMTEQAAENGIPREMIQICSITDMAINNVRVANASVDHIFSHSVIWGLPNPVEFVKEAQRVLKPGGLVTVTTITRPYEELVPYFLKTMDDNFATVEKLGLIQHEQRTKFIEQNSHILGAVKSPQSKDDLRNMFSANGFGVVEIGDAYMVDTPVGPKPFFNRIVARKR